MELKLGEQLKKLRTDRGITQLELAKALQVSPQAISRWENGQALPDISLLPELADFFSVSIDALMGRRFEGFFSIRLARAEEEARLERTPQNKLIVHYLLREGITQKDSTCARYFASALRLRDEGLLSPGQVDEAREEVQAYLRSRPAAEIGELLRHIFYAEDEEQLESWHSFLPDSPEQTWEEMLCYRHLSRAESGKALALRGHITLDTMERLCLRQLAGPLSYDQCTYAPAPLCNVELALQILGCFSTRVDDILLPLRILLEGHACKSAFFEGDREKGERYAADAAEHLELLWSVLGTERRGSVPALENEREIAYDGQIVNCYHSITGQLHEALAAYPDGGNICLRIVSSLRCWANDMYERFSPEDAADYKMLLAAARDAAKKLPKGFRNREAVALLTEKGVRIYSSTDFTDKSVIEAFFAGLHAEKNTRVYKMVHVWGSGAVEAPSWDFLTAVYEIDHANGAARYLATGELRFIDKTVDWWNASKRVRIK